MLGPLFRLIYTFEVGSGPCRPDQRHAEREENAEHDFPTATAARHRSSRKKRNIGPDEPPPLSPESRGMTSHRPEKKWTAGRDIIPAGGNAHAPARLARRPRVEQPAHRLA